MTDVDILLLVYCTEWCYILICKESEQIYVHFIESSEWNGVSGQTHEPVN